MESNHQQVLDQMGCRVDCPKFPQRIISLVPSQTELLFDLGLADRVVGVTKFCIHPMDQVRRYAKIGGTKKFNIDKIKALNPDLIIGNKEENYKEGIDELKRNYPVWMSDIVTLEDSLYMMQQIGRITNTMKTAEKIVDEIKVGFGGIKSKAKRRGIYLIWQNPNMAAGTGTFIHSMMNYAGFENLIKHDRYPEQSDDQIISYNPEYILLSSEPYPFKERHIEAFREMCPSAKVLLVDGELFSWYGSRLRYTPAYFNKLIHEIDS